MRKIGLLTLLVLFLIALGTAFFFPLHLEELHARYKLSREGITQVESAGLHGYLRDNCKNAPAGKGCTCVALIHGLADNALTWNKIQLWPENGWPEPVKLYAFDLPGSGQSSAPADLSDYRVRRQAARLKQALAPLCSHWTLVGNSLGGWVASWLALDWSEGVSKVILVDSAGLNSEINKSELRSYFVDPTVDSLKEFQSKIFYQGYSLPDSVWRAVASRMKASNARHVLEAQTPEDFLEGRVTSLRRPTLVFWGAADRLISVNVGQQLRAMIPGAAWQLAPQCGHMPQKECPVELIRAIGSLVRAGGV